MVTSRGATSWKSPSKVVLVDGTITPIRLRRLIARYLPGARYHRTRATLGLVRRRIGRGAAADVLDRNRALRPAPRRRRGRWPVRARGHQGARLPGRRHGDGD